MGVSSKNRGILPPKWMVTISWTNGWFGGFSHYFWFNTYLKSNFIVVPFEKKSESRALLVWKSRRCSVPSQRTCPPAQGLDYWQESFRDFSTNLQIRGTPFPASHTSRFSGLGVVWEYGWLGVPCTWRSLEKWDPWEFHDANGMSPR